MWLPNLSSLRCSYTRGEPYPRVCRQLHQSIDGAPYDSHECSRSHLTAGQDLLNFTPFDIAAFLLDFNRTPYINQEVRYLNDTATV